MWVSQEGLVDKLLFEQRPEGSEGRIMELSGKGLLRTWEH